MADKDQNGLQAMVRYLGLAFVIPVAIFIGYAIGYYLDKTFHTTFLKIVCLLIGIAAGFLEMFRELQQDAKDK